MPDDPLWINTAAGSPAMDAREMRRLFSAFWGQGGAGDRFGARSGVHPGGSDAVSLAGSTVTVQHIKGVIYQSGDTLRGPYMVAIQGTSFALTPADASNPRKDIVVARVYDHDEDSSGQRTAQIEYIVGVPSGTPSEQPVPAGAVKLATIDVPVAPNPATLTYNAPFVVAVGGILPVRTTADLPTVGVYPGMWADVRDVKQLVRWSGSAWEVAAAAPETITTGVLAATGFSVSAFRLKKMAGVFATGQLAFARTGADIPPDGQGNISDTLVATLPVGSRPAATEYMACGDGFSSGECRIDTNGEVILRSWESGGVVTAGRTVRLPLKYDPA